MRTAPPLDGVTVLDLSRVLAGPYAAMMLADLGARLIKVERPRAGDDTRQWGPRFVGRTARESTYYLSINRNRQSIELDVKDDADRAVLEALRSLGCCAAWASARERRPPLRGSPSCLRRGARAASSERAQVVATVANLGRLGLGGLVAGILAQWAGHPLTVPFLVFVGGLLLTGLGLLAAPETRVPRSQRPRHRPQRVSVPRHARGRFFAAATGAAITFAIFGLVTSLAPSFLAGTLDAPSLALAGAGLYEPGGR